MRKVRSGKFERSLIVYNLLIIINNLCQETKSLRGKIENLAECIITLENECNALEQYGRRNNLKISGFLDSDPHDALEIKVIKYLNQ